MADYPPSFLTEADIAPTPAPSAPATAAQQFPPSFLTEADMAPEHQTEGRGALARVAADVGTGITEAPKQLVRGVEQAVNATSNATYDAATWLNTHILDLGQVTYDTRGSANPLNWHIGYDRGMPQTNSALIPDAAIPGHAESVTGGLIEGAAQFATGMLGAGKFLRAFGLGSAATGVVGSGMTMAAAFDPHEQRLADLVQQFPALQNPVTEFLALHPDDGAGMARVRAGLEGLGIGAVAEGVLAGLKGLKAHYAGKPEEAMEHVAPTPKPSPEGEKPEGALPEGEKPPVPEGAMELPEIKVEAERPGKPVDGPSGAPGATAGEPGTAPTEPPNSPQVQSASPTPDPERAAKLVTLSPDDLSRLRELQGNVERASGADADGTFRPLSGINTDAIEHAGDLGTIMDTLRVAYREAMDRAVGGSTPAPDGVSAPVRTLKEVERDNKRLADLIGANDGALLQRMGATHTTVLHLDAETRLYGDFLATVGDKLHKLAKAVDDPLGDLAGYADRRELLAQFAKHYELMANAQAMFKGIQTNVARTLNAFKLGSKINPDLATSLRTPDELAGAGLAQLEAMARRINASGGDLANVAKATRPGFLARFVAMGNEYWINSVLSGPKTHAANMIGNTVSAALLPAERMLAGALHFASPGGREEFLEGGLHYVGMAMSIRDAIALSAKALRMGEGILDASHTRVAEIGSPAISGANFGRATGSVSGAVVDGLGAFIRLPSRFLTAEDEFFKQLVYRGAVRARAMREAYTSGLWSDPKNPNAFGDYVARRLDDAATTTGIDDTALAMAREATFQNPLAAQTNIGTRTLGESIQGLTNAHPMLKVVLPFVRTPTNMMRFVWDRTPGINLLRGQYRNDLMGTNGSAAQGRASAKMLTGGLLWAGAITHALDGTVTGAGPADKGAQEALRATGWQPYSVKVQNDDGSFTYRSYNRLDPFGAFFGLAADFAEVAAAHPEKHLDDTATALVTALAKNLEEKTYVSGLVRAVAALGRPDRSGEGFAKGLAGGFVPSFLKQTLMQDDTMREARSVVDAMRAKTPGFSEDLDPQRNILGAAIHQTPSWGPDWLSPIGETTHPAGQAPLSAEWRATVQARPEDELARLAYLHGTSLKPPAATFGQLDLRDFNSSVTGKTAYDRLQELTGTVQISGLTLRQTMGSLFQQDYYRRILTDGDTMDHGSRVGAVETWIGAYRDMARQALFKEEPALGAAYQTEMMRKARARFQ